MRSDPGPARREAGLAALIAILLSCAMNVSVVRHLTTKVPGLHDGLIAAWEMSWNGRTITHDPGRFWQSNVHFLQSDAMAFHDSLAGYGIPFGWIGSTPKAALIRFNLLYLFAYALAAFGAWLLARELGLGSIPSAVAGLVFAYAPFRLAHPDHLHVLSSGGIPVAIALLIRGFRRKSPRTILGAWLVACWQLTLGFSTGLLLAYGLLGLAAFGVVWLLVNRPLVEPSLVHASIIGVMLFAGVSVVQSAPYLRVAERLPEAVHTVGEVRQYSPPPRGFLHVPSENLLWGSGRTRERKALGTEQRLFPGAAALILSALGLFAAVLSRWRRTVLLITVAMTAYLSMGFRAPNTRLYQFIYDHAPGWQGVRTPGRITALTILALGVLAAAGSQWVHDKLRGRRARTLVPMALCALVLIEGAGSIPQYTPPPAPAARTGLPQPQLHLPSGPTEDMHYMFWSIGEFPTLVNGHAVFTPRPLENLRKDVAGFPDMRSVLALRDLGVKVVVWHRRFAPGTPWTRVDEKPIDALGISKRDAGDVVIFRL